MHVIIVITLGQFRRERKIFGEFQALFRKQMNHVTEEARKKLGGKGERKRKLPPVSTSRWSGRRRRKCDRVSPEKKAVN